METYIELSALVYKHQSCNGIFTQELLIPNVIQSTHADYFGFSDDRRIDSSPNAPNQKIKLLEEKVTIHDSEKSLQTISPKLEFRGNGYPMHQPEGPLKSQQNQSTQV